jgi:hypothetical protein
MPRRDIKSTQISSKRVEVSSWFPSFALNKMMFKKDAAGGSAMNRAAGKDYAAGGCSTIL